MVLYNTLNLYFAVKSYRFPKNVTQNHFFGCFLLVSKAILFLGVCSACRKNIAQEQYHQQKQQQKYKQCNLRQHKEQRGQLWSLHKQHHARNALFTCHPCHRLHFVGDALPNYHLHLTGGPIFCRQCLFGSPPSFCQ